MSSARLGAPPRYESILADAAAAAAAVALSLQDGGERDDADESFCARGGAVALARRLFPAGVETQAQSGGNNMTVAALPLELWQLVWQSLPRRVRIRVCATCAAWHTGIWLDPATWRFIVCGGTSLLETTNDSGQASAADFEFALLETDALHLTQAQLALIPDASFVEILVHCNTTRRDFDCAYGPEAQHFHEANWPALNALCGMHFPSLRALRVQIQAIEMDLDCVPACRVALFDWLCELPTSVEYLHLDADYWIMEDKLLPYLQRRRKCFADWLPNLKSVFMEHGGETDDGGVTDGAKRFASLGPLLGQFEVLDLNDLFLTLDESSPWLEALNHLRAERVSLRFSGDETCFVRACRALPATVRTLHLYWDSAEALTLDEWGCVIKLTGLSQLHIMCDSCEWRPGEGPKEVTRHLSGLLPHATVLVCTHGGAEDERPAPPRLSHEIFTPGAVAAWARHGGSCGPTHKLLPVGTLRY
jgi:hypothetical protein